MTSNDPTMLPRDGTEHWSTEAIADVIKREPIKQEVESMEFEPQTSQNPVDNRELPRANIKEDPNSFCETLTDKSIHDSDNKVSQPEFPWGSQKEPQCQCVAGSSPNQSKTNLPIIVSVVGATQTTETGQSVKACRPEFPWMFVKKPWHRHPYPSNSNLPIIASVVGTPRMVTPRNNRQPEWTRHINYKAAAKLMTKNVKILPKPITSNQSQHAQKPKQTFRPTLIGPSPMANYASTQNLSQALPSTLITANSLANYISTQNLNQISSQILNSPNLAVNNLSLNPQNLNQTSPQILKAPNLAVNNLTPQNLNRTSPQILKNPNQTDNNLSPQNLNQTSPQSETITCSPSNQAPPHVAPKKNSPEIHCKPSVPQTVTCSTWMNQAPPPLMAPILVSPFAPQTFCQYPNIPVIGAPVQVLGLPNNSLPVALSPNSQQQNFIGQLGQNISVIPPVISVQSSTSTPILNISPPSQSLQQSDLNIPNGPINTSALINSPSVDPNRQNALNQNNSMQGMCSNPISPQVPPQTNNLKDSPKKTESEMLKRKFASTHKSNAFPATATSSPVCTFTTPPVQTTLVTSDQGQSFPPTNLNITSHHQFKPVVKNGMTEVRNQSLSLMTNLLQTTTSPSISGFGHNPSSHGNNHHQSAGPLKAQFSQSEKTNRTPSNNVKSITPEDAGTNGLMTPLPDSISHEKKRNQKRQNPSRSFLDVPSLLQHKNKKDSSQTQQNRTNMATQNDRLSNGDNEASKDADQQPSNRKLRPRKVRTYTDTTQPLMQSPISPTAITTVVKPVIQHSVKSATPVIPATVTHSVTPLNSAYPAIAPKSATHHSFNSAGPVIATQSVTQCSFNSSVPAVAAQSSKYSLIKPVRHHKKSFVKRSMTSSEMLKSNDCKFILPKGLTQKEKINNSNGNRTSAVLFGPLTQNQIKDLFKAQRLKFKGKRCRTYRRKSKSKIHTLRIKPAEPSMRKSKSPCGSKAKKDIAKLGIRSVSKPRTEAKSHSHSHYEPNIHSFETSSSVRCSNILKPVGITTLTSNRHGSPLISSIETSGNGVDDDIRSHWSSCSLTVSVSDAVKLSGKIAQGKLNSEGEDYVRESRFNDDLLQFSFEGDMNVLADALRRCTVPLERINWDLETDSDGENDRKIGTGLERNDENDDDDDSNSADVKSDSEINGEPDLNGTDLSSKADVKDIDTDTDTSAIKEKSLINDKSTGTSNDFLMRGWKFDSSLNKFMEINIAGKVEEIWELGQEEDPILSRRKNTSTPNANNSTFLKGADDPLVSESSSVNPKKIPPSSPNLNDNENHDESSFSISQEMQKSFDSSSLSQQVWETSSKVLPTETSSLSAVITCIPKQEPLSPTPSPSAELVLSTDSIQPDSGYTTTAMSSVDSHTNNQMSENEILCDEKPKQSKSTISDETYHFSSEDEEDVFDDEEFGQSKQLEKEERKKLIVMRRNEKMMFLLYNSDKFIPQEDGQYRCNICEVYHTNGLFRLSKHLQKHLI